MPELPESLLPESRELNRNGDTKRVSITITLLTLAITGISMLKGNVELRAALLDKRSSDMWSYYQAKVQRQHADRIFVDTLSYAGAKDAKIAAQLKQQYSNEAEIYRDEQREIESKARELEEEHELQEKRGSRLESARSFIEIAQLLASTMLLFRWRPLWYGGIVMGTIGVLVAVSSLVMH